MADDREEIARAAWVLAVSDDPDFFGQEGAEFWERSKQITAERPEANCASLVNRCYSFADAILARAQGPGETVADGGVMVPKDDDARSFSDSTLPAEMIDAGVAVMDQVHHDNANYVAGETTDWDVGMVAVAVYRAMIAATPTRDA